MRIILIPLVVSFWIIDLSAQPSKPPSPAPSKAGKEPQGARSDKSRNAKPDHGATQSLPPTTNLPVAPQAQPIATNGTTQVNTKPATDWIVVFTGFLTLVAVLQWIAMLKQARYMRDGLTETKKAADAATKSATVAEEALRTSQRAYMSIAEWGTDNIHQRPIRIHYVISNKGVTIGTVYQLCPNWTVARELPESPIYGTTNDVSMPIAPGIRFSHAVIAPNLDGLDEALSQKTFLWFFGFLKYRDVFDAEHTLGFCLQYVVSVSEWHIGGPVAYNYSTYNQKQRQKQPNINEPGLSKPS